MNCAIFLYFVVFFLAAFLYFRLDKYDVGKDLNHGANSYQFVVGSNINTEFACGLIAVIA